MNSNVAVTKWHKDDGIATAIIDELNLLGYSSEGFLYDKDIPSNAGFILSFAPHGRIGALLDRVAEISNQNRQVLIHWNFESLPNLRIPWMLLLPMSKTRVWFDRWLQNRNLENNNGLLSNPLKSLNKKVVKYSNLGEYQFAHARGQLQLLADISSIYAEFYGKQGLNAKYIPFGTSPHWYSDLELERDIDVIWMGNRRTNRRSKILDRLRKQLKYFGIEICVMDNVEKPFIFGETRNQFLNRAKITLNLLPTWYDPAFIVRFHLAAGNRSLVVSEPILPHCPEHIAGQHYVEAKITDLAKTIHHYVRNEKDRQRITSNAYQLVTKKMTLQNSLKQLMLAAESVGENLHKNN